VPGGRSCAPRADLRSRVVASRERGATAAVYEGVPAEMEFVMVDRDRVKGAVKRKTGELKKSVGKLSGDEKLKLEGQAEEIRGKVQNTIGGLKDSLREDKGEHR
jgi:uncharacterized protein YjbJ (UPF0337 family)